MIQLAFKIKVTFTLLLIAGPLLTACSATPSSYRSTCASEVDAAWDELSIAKAAGFAGGVSYTKALSLITAARSMQTVENFDGCYKNASKARFYIQESKAGR